MASRSIHERGFSIIETLITLTILAVILVPIIQIFTQSQRQGVSARRLVDVVLHSQSILEALSQLEPIDFPPLPPAAQGTASAAILVNDDGRELAGSSTKYQQLIKYFKEQRPKNFEDMKRELSAQKLANGEVEVFIVVTWQGVKGEDRTRQKIILTMLSTPRNWR